MTSAGSLLGQAKIFSQRLLRVGLRRGRCVASGAFNHSWRSSLAGSEEGGALVEIALVTPVLLGVLTGIITFGLAFSNQLTLTQAVGTAGQYLSQIRTSTADPCADTLKALKNAAPNLVAANIAMTVTINGTSSTSTSCTNMQTTLVNAQGMPVTVYATYPCGLAIYGVRVAGSCQLAARVTEYEY